MPPQHIEIAETVAALRRKLRRDKEATSSSSITNNQTAQFASNRGNKLKPGVRYVHAASLPHRCGLGGYRETINHAGYSRQILQRNPPRTNEYGDELEDSEEDPEADIDAEDQDPYNDVKLEELLRPLTHPSELANHPAMAQAYLDPALNEMVAATELKIREERNNLWRAKNLYRHFIGDESWIPCGRAEHDEDWSLFEPNPSSLTNGRLSNGESPSKRRRLEADGLENGDIDGDVQIADALDGTSASEEVVNAALADLRNNANDDSMLVDQKEDPLDINMDDADQPKTNGIHKEHGAGESNFSTTETDGLPDKSNEEHETSRDSDPNGIKPFQDVEQDLSHGSTTLVTSKEIEDDDDNVNDDQKSSSPTSTPPPPTRRITRALAAEGATPQIASPPPTSPTLSIPSPSLLSPHPLFLLPQSLASYHAPHPSHPIPIHLAHSGLPPDELLETRKLLSLFIQKSEETIRGLESIYAKLYKAKRRRDLVWEWCATEGHVGEMSDGEDWIDVDKWGISKEELRKGRDEDGVGDVAGGNAGDDDGVGAGASGGAVVMGGRKGKRRTRTAAGAKERETGRERERDKDRDKERDKDRGDTGKGGE